MFPSWVQLAHFSIVMSGFCPSATFGRALGESAHGGKADVSATNYDVAVCEGFRMPAVHERLNARRRWIHEQGLLDSTRLVFIDETAVSTNMVRPNGWNPRGEGLVGDVPMGYWETLTFIAGFRQTGIVAPMLIKGVMNGEAFLAYVPTLKRRDIVVVDNVSFHKVAGVERAIQAAGASSRYLPQYSPEFNPIELVFRPLKALLRKAAERTIEGLERCVGSYIRALNPSECKAYFRHAGYEPL